MRRTIMILMGCVLLGAGCASVPGVPEQTTNAVVPPPPVAGAPSDAPLTSQEPIVPPETFLPLSRAGERVIKKPFGLRVSPGDSPVSPEKFSGYHTGTDFEAFADEQNADVPVTAVCTGALLRAGTASGYGGYAVQSCEINDEPVTVVYGHLRATSIRATVGDALVGGKPFAVLGTGESAETDGERKHLHLGIVRGAAINIRGYVSTTGELAGWMDAADVLPKE